MQIFKNWTTRFFKTYGYAIVPLLATFLLNDLVYWGAMVIAKDWPQHDFTSKIDQMTPFVPEFVAIYFLCYLFWVVNYLMAGGNGKEYFYRYLSADMAARLICFACFVLVPTTNIRPELVGDGWAVGLVDWLYRIDKPANLFPSIHCMNSWFCFIAVRGRKNVPVWYQYFSLAAALAVGASTVLIKQHYLLDVFSGFLLAEMMWQLSWRVNSYKNVMKVFEKINGKFHKKLVE